MVVVLTVVVLTMVVMASKELKEANYTVEGEEKDPW